MSPDRVDDLRRDLHAVQVDLTERMAVLETRSDERHGAVMSALADLRRDLSDQGRTPPPPPSLPPTALHEEPSADSSSDPGAITISPKRVAPWLRLLLPYLLAGGFGAAATQGAHLVTEAMSASATVSEDVVP